MLNEYDNANDRTENFIKHREVMKNLSIANIVRASDYINRLSHFIPQDNEVLDNLEDIQSPLMNAINELRTDKDCVHCGGCLFLSDLPQYDYVCPTCDENF